jgi:hypothetical protein
LPGLVPDSKPTFPEGLQGSGVQQVVGPKSALPLDSTGHPPVPVQGVAGGTPQPVAEASQTQLQQALSDIILASNRQIALLQLILQQLGGDTPDLDGLDNQVQLPGGQTWPQ